jgi:hypothetical protein
MSTQHLVLVVQEHHRIVIESHPVTIWPTDGLFAVDNNGAMHVTTVDLEDIGDGLGTGANWLCMLDDADNLVANTAPTIVDLIFEHIDALYKEAPQVIYDL